VSASGHDPATLLTAFEALLAKHPNALVAAIGQDGLFLSPDALPLTTHRPAWGRSALELVVPADRIVIIESWERARSLGATRAVVHLRSQPDDEVAIHFLDVRERYGVFAGIVLAGEEADDRAVGMTPAAPIPPRVGTSHKSDLAVITWVDDRLCEMLGWAAEEIVGKRSLEFIHPDDHEKAINNWMEILEAPGRRQPLRVRHLTASGKWIWVEITNTNRLADPAVNAVVAEVLDVSDEMATQDALRAREELFRRVAESVPVGLVELDPEGQVTYANPRLAEIIGGEVPSSVIELLSAVVEDEREAVLAALRQVMASDEDCDLEASIARPSGDVRLCTLAMRPIADGAAGALICVTDVTESARLRGELERRANYDALTSCLNRQSIVGVLEAHLASPCPSGTGVLFLDIDRFKDVNDTLGHAVGDEVLRVVASRVEAVLRDQDQIGRLGGDEFLIVCPSVGSEAELLAIAERVAETVGWPIPAEGHSLVCTASVGARYVSGSQSADQTLAAADLAMYQSKRAGAGRPVLAG
jgi:diguanylate cyclase (GGDEF)-like protein/PAS domain S-box-containing protein